MSGQDQYYRVIKDNDNDYGSWIVLSPDLRDILFRANTEEQCFRWLRSECPTGKCED